METMAVGQARDNEDLRQGSKMGDVEEEHTHHVKEVDVTELR